MNIHKLLNTTVVTPADRLTRYILEEADFLQVRILDKTEETYNMELSIKMARGNNKSFLFLRRSSII